MEDLVQKLLNNKDLFQKKLDVDFLFNIKRNNLDSGIKEKLEKSYHKLFDCVDRELKRNVELNNQINEIVKIDNDLKFDLKNYFYQYDENDVKTFSQEKYNNAQDFVQNWEMQKIQLLEKIEKLKNRKYFKNIAKTKIDRLNLEIENNDYKFEENNKIFAKEKELKEIDKEKFKKIYNEKKVEIDKAITETIDKYVEQFVTSTPKLIAFGKIFKDYYISSYFLTNKNNKNLADFFNNSLITKRLNKIFDEYKKEIKKEENLGQEENKITDRKTLGE